MNDKVPRRKKKSIRKLLRHKVFRMRNIFVLIATIVSIILSLSIAILNIISYKHIVIFLGIFILINFIGAIFINAHKMIILKILGGFIITSSIVFSIGGLFLTKSTSNFISNNFNEDSHTYTQNTYYLLGDSNTNLSSEEITGDYGLYENMFGIEKADEKLNKKYNLNKVEYKDIYEMFTAMSTNQIKYILIEKITYKNFFLLNSGINKNNYKIIYEYDVYNKNIKNYSKNKDKYNILIRTINESGICNNNIILTINMNNNKILSTYIPSYEYAYIKDLDRYEKIEYIDVYGKEKILEWIKDTIEIDIDYTIEVDEKELSKLIDYIGSIELCTKSKIVLDNNNTISEGCNNIDGKQLLLIMSQNELKNKNNLLGKILKNTYYKSISTAKINNYGALLEHITKTIETNIPKDIGCELIRNLIYDKAKWNIESITLSGKTSDYPVLTLYTSELVQVSSNDDINIVKNKIKETLN